MLRLMRIRLYDFAERRAAWHSEMEQLATREVLWANRTRMWWSAKYASWWAERGRWHSRRKKLWTTLRHLMALP